MIPGWVCLALIGFQADTIKINEGLGIPSVGRSGRNALHQDAIEAAIVKGTWKDPASGETVALPAGGSRTWTEVKAGADGVFGGPATSGGYVFATFDNAKARTGLLAIEGASLAYVNGEIHMGDPYSNGSVRWPVPLKAGKNTLLMQAGRGRLKVWIEPMAKPFALNPRDMTLPDLLSDERGPWVGAIPVVNGTDEYVNDLRLSAKVTGGATIDMGCPTIHPMGSRKVAFSFNARPPAGAGSVKVTVELRRGRELMDQTTFDVRVRSSKMSHRRTFVSGIDGSVQYYGVNPAQGTPEGEKPALILSLHGASVEAMGQADAYSSKSWAYLVAPTNRRPYGFDWEDWGRMDALEVLAVAKARFQPPGDQVYLTGHSMGGHGTWHVGLTYPDLFAAIGPSAGWASFFSYGGMRRLSDTDEVQAQLMRATNGSNTPALVRNALQFGVYVLHGDADDNVPVSEARTMRELLSFHPDLQWHEQKGAGHWWDASDEAGADCVDWAPMWEMFVHRRIPHEDQVRSVDFTTANPAVSAHCQWLTIEQSELWLKPASAAIQVEPHKARFFGKTDNVRRLTLRLAPVERGKPVTVELDGDKVVVQPKEDAIHLARLARNWMESPVASTMEKGPQRAGPFKDAFRNRMVFVVPTAGAAAENAAWLSKARYDAEQWEYRGNGAVDVIRDTDFVAAKFKDRSVVLFGDKDGNRAWAGLVGDSPIQVGRGFVKVGSQERRADDLCALFARPRPDSQVACVAVIAASGMAGIRLSERIPYFVSGVAFPDWTVMSSDTLSKDAEGVVGIGWFGSDWALNTQDMTWRK